MTAPGQIIILNGAPRAGKSSIAAALQERFDGVWVNLGVDAQMASLPERLRPGIGLRPGGDRPEIEALVPALYVALYDSIAAYSQGDRVNHFTCSASPPEIRRPMLRPFV